MERTWHLNSSVCSSKIEQIKNTLKRRTVGHILGVAWPLTNPKPPLDPNGRISSAFDASRDVGTIL